MEEVREFVISREFDAHRSKVWRAWTDPEYVKRWWGPEHFIAPYAEVDLHVGGKYLYAMKSPEAEVYWSGGEFLEIIPEEKIVSTDYFTDENGNYLDPKAYKMPAGMPKKQNATIIFEDVSENKTRLTIKYKPESQKEYDAMMEAGMTEGWSTSLDKFEESLKV